MSDMLSHWALFEDTRKIAAHDAGFEAELTSVIDRNLEYARLGTVSRGGNRWMQPIIERARAAWSRPDAHPEQDRKLAFALGGLPHQAIDHVVKPHRAEVVERNDAGPDPVENAHRLLYAYHDAFLFKRVFGGGEGDDAFFNRFLLADNDAGPGPAIEDYARSMVLRGLQGVHTLAPNEDDMDAWLDRAIGIVQPVTVDIQRLVDASVRPDPKIEQRFRLEEDFYREADPAVALAERVRAGASPSQDQIEVAMDTGANTSVYGRSLAVSLAYMREGARFWRGETDAIDTPNYDTSEFWEKEDERGRRRKQDVTAARSS